MRFLPLAISFLASASPPEPTGAVRGGGLGCAFKTENQSSSNPPRLCELDVLYDSDRRETAFGKACEGKRLLAFLSQCNPIGGMTYVTNVTVYHDYKYTPECWSLNCNVSNWV